MMMTICRSTYNLTEMWVSVTEMWVSDTACLVAGSRGAKRQALRSVYATLNEEQRQDYRVCVAQMRLQTEAESLGYKTPVDLAATDPSLPLNVRSSMARRAQREGEALLIEQEVSASVRSKSVGDRGTALTSLPCAACAHTLQIVSLDGEQTTRPSLGTHSRRPDVGQEAEAARLRQGQTKAAHEAVQAAERELRLHQKRTSGNLPASQQAEGRHHEEQARGIGVLAGAREGLIYLKLYKKRGTQVVLRGTQALQRLTAPGWRKHENATQTLLQDVVSATSHCITNQSEAE
jgi:hypothetical protein